MTIKNYLYATALLIVYSIAIHTQVFKEISALEFGQLHPDAQIIQCTKDLSFNFKSYPLYPELAHEKYPHQGLYQDTYVLSIPNATAYFFDYNPWGVNGFIFINNYLIKECQIKNMNLFSLLKVNAIKIHGIETINRFQIKGSLAICSHFYPDCYGHFMLDVLCQLALLEIFNINYDYLCIPYNAKFMQEALELWGIDKSKIIPLNFGRSITADTIILPTSVTQTKECAPNANYSINFLIRYVSKKLLDGAKKINITKNWPNKIFISRKDAPDSKRFVPNEDEIFQAFQAHGFQKYELTTLSLVEQILLFHNAKEIVSFVGSGSLNVIFSQPNTKYIEIVQSMLDATFFFLTNIFELTYYNIDATDKNHIAHSHPYAKACNIDIEIIQNFLKDYL